MATDVIVVVELYAKIEENATVTNPVAPDDLLIETQAPSIGGVGSVIVIEVEPLVVITLLDKGKVRVDVAETEDNVIPPLRITFSLDVPNTIWLEPVIELFAPKQEELLKSPVIPEDEPNKVL